MTRMKGAMTRISGGKMTRTIRATRPDTESISIASITEPYKAHLLEHQKKCTDENNKRAQ